MSITIKRQVHFQAVAKGRKEVRRGNRPEQPKARIPRITRLMALAIHFDQMLRERKVKDLAELARLGQVSRARVTQVMNLLNLTPEIQEDLLFFTPAKTGREWMTERVLRTVIPVVNWGRQAQLLHAMREQRLRNRAES